MKVAAPLQLSTFMAYDTHVCDKIIRYQQNTPDAFVAYYRNRGLTIDHNYVDGISLTHGHNPRKHIWTFVAALN